jgi:hypothetical protein
MLNGLDPIILFNFKKLADFLSVTTKIPLVANREITISLPAIPIYLSEKLTGIYIDTEDKNIDIDTTIDSLSDGSTPNVTQRTVSSTVKINLLASRDSIGVALFSALADLVFPKVTSKEYSITYLHGPVTVFEGLLHSFSIAQEANSDLYKIAIELVHPGTSAKSAVPVVAAISGAVPL